MNAIILTLCFIGGLAAISGCAAVPIIRECALNATELLSTARAGLVNVLNNHTNESRWSSALTAAADHRDHMEVDFICRHMGYVEMSMYTTFQHSTLNNNKASYRDGTLRRLCHIWVSF